MTTSEPEIENGVRHINTLAFPLQGSASGGEKRTPDELNVTMVFAACLKLLTYDQCAVILADLGHKITESDGDTKKYLAMLFVDVLNEGYKEYSLWERNVERDGFE